MGVDKEINFVTEGIITGIRGDRFCLCYDFISQDPAGQEFLIWINHDNQEEIKENTAVKVFCNIVDGAVFAIKVIPLYRMPDNRTFGIKPFKDGE